MGEIADAWRESGVDTICFPFGERKREPPVGEVEECTVVGSDKGGGRFASNTAEVPLYGGEPPGELKLSCPSLLPAGDNAAGVSCELFPIDYVIFVVITPLDGV